jgi:hypothetical protein
MQRNISEAQKEYSDLVFSFHESVNKSNFSVVDMSKIIDHIKIFWLKKRAILEFEIEELTSCNDCYCLCGAIYLDIDNYEHYYFKSIGDQHLLFDPFLKLEVFVRTARQDQKATNLIELFKRTYTDTIEILTNYSDSFTILPLQMLAIDDVDSHQKLLNSFFLSFLATSLNEDFETADDFIEKYDNYEQIEENLDSSCKDKLVYEEIDESSLSLREKIERHTKSQSVFSDLVKSGSESQIFYACTFTKFAQIIDQVLTCSYLRLIPYIRFDITFHYFIVLAETLGQHPEIESIIDKIILFYIFRMSIQAEIIKTIDFDSYRQRIAEGNLFDCIQSKLINSGINYRNPNIKKMRQIIQQEFDTCFNPNFYSK